MSALFQPRYIPFLLAIVATLLFASSLTMMPHALLLQIGFAVTAFLTVVGIHDLIQKRHAILRNYPISAHMRFIFEAIRPEIRQYFFESDSDGRRSAATAAPWSTSAPRCSSTSARSAPSSTSMATATSGSAIRSRRAR